MAQEPTNKRNPPAHPTPRKNLLFQKVAIFVDAENIEMSSLKHHEGRTDYKKILDRVGDREIIRILYYKPIYKDISPEFMAFWSSLGGEIRRPTKNADTFLVIDAVTMAEKIDVAIILGGDKDFQPLIWYLRSRGCRVEIWSWPETTSPEMQEASDFYQPLTEEFVIGKGTHKEPSAPKVLTPPAQATVTVGAGVAKEPSTPAAVATSSSSGAGSGGKPRSRRGGRGGSRRGGGGSRGGGSGGNSGGSSGTGSGGPATNNGNTES